MFLEPMLEVAALPALSAPGLDPTVVLAPLFPVPPEPVPFDCAKAEPATKRAAAAVNALAMEAP